jgi:hypothetical protein
MELSANFANLSCTRVDGLARRRQRNSTKKNRRLIFRVIAIYRLCNSVADLKHSKNLYRRRSETILRNAETIFVGELRQESDSPHHICVLASLLQVLVNYIYQVVLQIFISTILLFLQSNTGYTLLTFLYLASDYKTMRMIYDIPTYHFVSGQPTSQPN